MPSKDRYFLGFDCSSKMIHMVQLDAFTDEIVRMESWKNNSKDMDQRINETLAAFEGWYDSHMGRDCHSHLGERFMAFIENPIYVQNVKATIGISSMIAGVKHFIYQQGINCFGMDNRSWKKDIVGNGKASKEEIMRFAEAKWGKGKFPEQDFADAACIALWGRIRFGRN